MTTSEETAWLLGQLIGIQSRPEFEKALKEWLGDQPELVELVMESLRRLLDQLEDLKPV